MAHAGGESGRVYECANRSVAGFPFRMEVNCESPVVTLTSQTAEQIQLTARLKDILVVAQVYDPTRIIAEFTGPADVSNRGETPSFRRQLDHRACQRIRPADAAARLGGVRRSGAGPHQRRSADALAAREAS